MGDARGVCRHASRCCNGERAEPTPDAHITADRFVNALFAGDLRTARALTSEADRGMKASVDMSTALKKRDVNRASELAEEAQSHFQHVVERLDAIPVPEDEDLQTFLRQTIQGYKLIANAHEDFARGTHALDLASVKTGDAEFRRGFRIVNEAARDLATRAQERSE